jgi:hypothetical protein
MVRLWNTVPLRERLEAWREARAVRSQAERLVERLFRERKEPSEVARALRADPALSAPLRREAQRALWHRTARPE